MSSILIFGGLAIAVGLFWGLVRFMICHWLHGEYSSPCEGCGKDFFLKSSHAEGKQDVYVQECVECGLAREVSREFALVPHVAESTSTPAHWSL